MLQCQKWLGFFYRLYILCWCLGFFLVLCFSPLFFFPFSILDFWFGVLTVPGLLTAPSLVGAPGGFRAAPRPLLCPSLGTTQGSPLPVEGKLCSSPSLPYLMRTFTHSPHTSSLLINSSGITDLPVLADFMLKKEEVAALHLTQARRNWALLSIWCLLDHLKPGHL